MLDRHPEALGFKPKAGSLALLPGPDGELARVLFGLGDTETALSVLESALESGYANFERLRKSPHFESLRSDPRFQALLDKYESASQ